MQLVLATKNRDKIREIKNLLSDLPIRILTLEDFPDFPEIKETGKTLKANAVLKAKGIAQFAGMVAVADDSGLEVDALKGKPGVYSSRYAGDDCTYDDNNRKLLEELEEVPEEKRTARFRAVIAIAWDKSKIDTVEGRADGVIMAQKQGKSGFGYDPIFYYSAAQKTFAEMTLEEKNSISHRGKALIKAKGLLIRRLKEMSQV